MDDAAIEVRVARLEQDVIDLRNKALGELRETLRIEYYNKYQIQSEFLSRKENENMINARTVEAAESGKRRREWPVILGAIVVCGTSIVSVILQATGH